MAEIIEFDPFYNSCPRCFYHDPQNRGICQKPGGWKYDEKHRRCADFRRRKEARHDD